jgi:uridylate kinase
MQHKAAYRRILLKLSGEALSGGRGSGFDTQVVAKIADAIARVAQSGVQVGVVCGAGNFWRGRDAQGMVRTTADYMGMLGTLMNCLMLSDAIERAGVRARVQSALAVSRVAGDFNRREAIDALENGEVVLFACGTGEPYFSTDTTCVLRALEIEADAILVAKNGVEGVLTGDPRDGGDYELIERITFDEILARNLAVMDATAFAMCRENGMPMRIFGMDDVENILRAVSGAPIGTHVECAPRD